MKIEYKIKIPIDFPESSAIPTNKMQYIYDKDKQNFKGKTGVLLSRNTWIVRRLTE